MVAETTRGAVGMEDGRDARAVTGLPSTGAEEDHASLAQASERRAAAREGQPSLEDVTLLLQRAAEIPISDEWASEAGNTSSAAHGEGSADGTPRDTARYEVQPGGRTVYCTVYSPIRHEAHAGVWGSKMICFRQH